MKKTPQQKNNSKRSFVQGDSVLHSVCEKQVPFLYIAMKEPSAEYKKAGESKQKLYRFIKIKNQS